MLNEAALRAALEGKFYHGPASFQEQENKIHDENDGDLVVAVELNEDIKIKVSPISIMRAVMAAHHLPHELFLSRTRDPKITDARQHFYWMCRTLRPDIGFQRIVEFLGFGDHTTALHGFRSFPAKRKNFITEISASIQTLEEEYGEGSLSHALLLPN